ncbi:hypothetical protein Aduo_018446 [Ancylostoma duodenale]
MDAEERKRSSHDHLHFFSLHRERRGIRKHPWQRALLREGPSGRPYAEVLGEEQIRRPDALPSAVATLQQGQAQVRSLSSVAHHLVRPELQNFFLPPISICFPCANPIFRYISIGDQLHDSVYFELVGDVSSGVYDLKLKDVAQDAVVGSYYCTVLDRQETEQYQADPAEVIALGQFPFAERTTWAGCSDISYRTLRLFVVAGERPCRSQSR